VRALSPYDSSSQGFPRVQLNGKRIALFPSGAQSSSTPWRLHVRAKTLTITLLVLAAACENTNDPFLFGQGGGGGGAVTQAQVTGNWSFTVTKTSTFPCTVGSFPDASRLAVHLDVLADGTLNTSTSNWQSPSTGSVFPLSGSVTLSTGFTDLIFSGGGSIASGMELRGTISPTGSFSGTLTDPAPGLGPISGSACEYSTGGTKA
jgi:hypothetical protein